MSKISEKPYFLVRLNYNLVNSALIQKQQPFALTFERFTDRLRASKMKRDDLILLVHGAPSRYAGANSLLQVESNFGGVLKVNFVRYLKKIVSVNEIQQIEPSTKSSTLVYVLTEAVFLSLLSLENGV